MSEQQVDIFVAGPAHAGKSALVEVLKSALAEAGLNNVEVVSGVSPANPQLVLPAMVNTPIRIVETTYDVNNRQLPQRG